MYHYKSDATCFLETLIEDKPELGKERLRNRALLWDVTLDEQEQAGFRASAVAKKPYTYQPD